MSHLESLLTCATETNILIAAVYSRPCVSARGIQQQTEYVRTYGAFHSALFAELSV